MPRAAKPLFMLLVLSLAVTLLLAACGDPATAKPNPTTAATTTAAITTAAATTAVPTTVAATTMAATTAAITTAAPTTTVAATTAAANTTVAATATKAAPTTAMSTPTTLTAVTPVSTRAATSLITLTPFTSLEGGFTVSMPGTPKLETVPVGSAGQSINLYQYSVELTNPDSAYNVSYADYPANVKPDSSAVLNGTRDGQIGSEGKLLSDKDIMQGQVPGKEIAYTRNGTYFKAHIFFNGSRLYQIVAGCVEGKQDEQLFQTFLNSFKFTTSATTAPTNSAQLARPLEIAVDPAITAALTEVLPRVKDLSVQMFVSDDPLDQVLAANESDLLKQGYKVVSGKTKYIKNGTSYIADYSKAGAPDFLIVFGALSDNPTQLASNLKDFGVSVPGLGQADQTKLAAAFKGHQSVILVVAGTDLLNFGDTVVQPPTSTTATASNSSDLTEFAVDPAIKAGFAAKLAGVADLKVQMFVSNSSFDNVAMTTDSALLKNGYKFAGPNSTITQLYKLNSGQSYGGGYRQAGTADLILSVTNLDTSDSHQLASNLQELNIPGIDQADGTKFAAQIQGKKTLVLLVSGTGLIEKIANW